MAERSYPTSEVRGSGQECQTATAQERPRGATPRPGGGGAAERRHPASEVRGSGREELPHAPTPEARGHSQVEQPIPEARGSGREDQTHIQGAMAARVQEGIEELSHVEGQEGWW